MVDLPLNGRNPFSLATLAPGVPPTSNNGGSSPSISGGRNATQRGRHRRRLQRQRREQRLDPRPELHAVGRRRAGVQRPDQRGQRRVRPPRRRRHQPDHEERQQHAARHGLGVRAQRQDGRHQLLHQSRRRQEGRLQAQPVRRQPRRPAQQGQDVLLRQLRRAAPGERRGLRPSRCRCRSGATATSRTSATARGSSSPSTTRRRRRPDPANPGQFIRDPFPGNLIPAEPHQPDGAGDDGLLAAAEHDADQRRSPRPTTTRSRACRPARAIASIRASTTSSTTAGARFVRYSYSNEASLPFNSFGNAASSSGGDGPTYTKTHSLSVDHNYTLGPTWVLNVRYGLNRRLVDRLPLSAGFDLASLGFPAQRHRHGRRLRVPARQRAELPVARPEHVHRPEDRADDPQLQRRTRPRCGARTR